MIDRGSSDEDGVVRGLSLVVSVAGCEILLGRMYTGADRIRPNLLYLQA